jgi:hypothetical protein
VKDADGTIDEAGISVTQTSSHNAWRKVLVNRMVFTNVTRRVELVQGSGGDAADILLTVSNTAIWAKNDGLVVDYPKPYNYRVQATLRNCTVADNGQDGLQEWRATTPNWASVTNCIFANNCGEVLSLGTKAGPVFTCVEGYNVFYSDGLFTNGAANSLGANTSTSEPLFWAKDANPEPWYWLASKGSPAYHRATDGRNRGAYQAERILKGSMVLTG